MAAAAVVTLARLGRSGQELLALSKVGTTAAVFPARGQILAQPAT